VIVNKDLGLKEKAKGKDSDPKAKAKDLSHKAKAKAKAKDSDPKAKDMDFGLKDQGQGQGITSLRYTSQCKLANEVIHKRIRANRHRHTSQGGWGTAVPPDSGKAIIFRAKAKFFGQKPQPKMKQFFLFIKRRNGIHSV